MNTWARTDERGGNADFNRRVYRREFAAGARLWHYMVPVAGKAWGDLLLGRRDPGGKRLWWPASEVRATLDKLNAIGRADGSMSPPMVPMPRTWQASGIG